MAKEAEIKLERSQELLVREKDLNAIMRHEKREIDEELDKVTIERDDIKLKYKELANQNKPKESALKELDHSNKILAGSMAAVESELKKERNHLKVMRQELLIKSSLNIVNLFLTHISY